MNNIPFQKKNFENAKRYYSKNADFKFVENRLAEDGIEENEVTAIIIAIKKDLRFDNKADAKKKLLTGFLLVVAAGTLVIISTGGWFQSQVVGIIGIIIMIYGFVRMGSGLLVVMEIENSSFVRQFDVFKIKKKKHSSNIVEKKPLKKN